MYIYSINKVIKISKLTGKFINNNVDQVQTRYCVKCGQIVTGNFCSQCGKKVD